MDKKVKIFTTPTCTYCKMAKEFFEENNVEYEHFDVTVNEDARNEMIEKSGQMGVPVIMIDDEVVVGFNQEKLSELLEIK